MFDKTFIVWYDYEYDEIIICQLKPYDELLYLGEL